MNKFWNIKDDTKHHFGISILDGEITRDSEAGLGFYCIIYTTKDICDGQFCLGIFAGRYLFDFNLKKGFNFCNFFATGLGG